MARHPCHSTAALAGSQAWRHGRGRQASARVLRVSHRRGQDGLSRQAAHPVSQPCPRGAEIMGGVEGKWLAWPGGGAGHGIWVVPGERRNPPQNALQSGGAAYLHPISPHLPKSGAPQPLLARILLSRGLGSHHPAASMWLKRVIIHHGHASPPTPRPDLGCVWYTHRCTHAPSHIHTFAHSQGPR